MIFTLNVASTLYMVGVIWLVQLVHYPMFQILDESNFNRAHNFHLNRMSYVVVIPMVIELTTSCLLVWFNPRELGNVIGLTLVLAIWLLTFLKQVPEHNQLAKGWDTNIIKKLTSGNLHRAVLWTAKGAIAVYDISTRIQS